MTKKINEYYKGLEYYKKEITDSFAILDLATGGYVVESIRNTIKESKNDSALSDLSHELEQELYKALLSYETRPILLGDKENVAFVVPSFTASTGMYILTVPNVSPKSVSFALQNGIVDDVLVLGELAEYTRVSKRMREESKMLKEWIDGFYLCFSSRNENDSTVFHEFLRSRISNISEYIGVNARIVTLGQVSDKNFDFGLFLAFVTVMLMFARMRSRDNSVLVSIGEDERGMFVTVDFSFDGQALRYDREMLVFKGMVDRKRVLFEAIEKSDAISIKISPIIEDWSLLELKVPDNEEMEFELT